MRYIKISISPSSFSLTTEKNKCGEKKSRLGPDISSPLFTHESGNNVIFRSAREARGKKSLIKIFLWEIYDREADSGGGSRAVVVSHDGSYLGGTRQKRVSWRKLFDSLEEELVEVDLSVWKALEYCSAPELSVISCWCLMRLTVNISKCQRKIYSSLHLSTEKGFPASRENSIHQRFHQ